MPQIDLIALRHEFQRMPELRFAEESIKARIAGILEGLGVETLVRNSAAVPGCFLLMGNGQEGPCGQPLHSDDYDFNDDLLPIGAAFWAQLVRDRLPLTGKG